MNRILAVLVLLSIAAYGRAADLPVRPNILVVITDDQRTTR